MRSCHKRVHRPIDLALTGHPRNTESRAARCGQPQDHDEVSCPGLLIRLPVVSVVDVFYTYAGVHLVVHRKSLFGGWGTLDAR